MKESTKFAVTTVLFGMLLLGYGAIVGGAGGLMVFLGGVALVTASKYVKINDDV